MSLENDNLNFIIQVLPLCFVKTQQLCSVAGQNVKINAAYFCFYLNQSIIPIATEPTAQQHCTLSGRVVKARHKNSSKQQPKPLERSHFSRENI